MIRVWEVNCGFIVTLTVTLWVVVGKKVQYFLLGGIDRKTEKA